MKGGGWRVEDGVGDNVSKQEERGEEKEEGEEVREEEKRKWGNVKQR